MGRTRVRRFLLSPWLPIGLFAALLLVQLFRALLPNWLDGTYYDYGLAVPLLLPIFFYLRWQALGSERPDADHVVTVSRDPWTWLPLLLVLPVIAFLRVVEAVDFAWRAPLYLHAALVIGYLAWLLVRLVGWRAAFSFLPCFILILLAIPLPSKAEASLIHGLTEGVVDVAVTVTRVMGIPVTSSGETLFANGVPLQVSDGCSGIRSFQSSIFAGFVLGEFARLGVLTRIFLIGFSLVTAFLLNCSRVVFLVHHSVAHPGENIDQVHDITGYVSLSLTFLVIFLLSRLLAGLERGLDEEEEDDEEPEPLLV